MNNSRLFPADASGWYWLACGLLVVKAIAVLFDLSGMARLGSIGIGHWIFLVGKITPTMICAAFLLDAVSMRRAFGTIAFWAIMTIVVPVFTVWFVQRLAHGQGLF